MPNDLLPPLNCNWWVIGDSTPNPPEDRDFLTALANAGFKTFIAEGGLIGALCGDRQIDVIHRGFGKRWRLSFIQSDHEQAYAIVKSLPRHVNAVITWLNSKTIDEVMQLLDV